MVHWEKAFYAFFRFLQDKFQRSSHRKGFVPYGFLIVSHALV
jgi:hypothetical protein